MKILLIHTKYQNIGGEDIAVESEATFLKNIMSLKKSIFQIKSQKACLINKTIFLFLN